MFVVRTHRPSHGKRLLCLLLVIACGIIISALSSVSQNAAPARTPHEDRIACERDGKIYLSDADGAGQLQLPTHGVVARDPAWSPDGQRLAFFRHALRVATDTRERTVIQGIYVANADGSGLTRLREPNGHNPAWRPKGSRP